MFHESIHLPRCPGPPEPQLQPRVRTTGGLLTYGWVWGGVGKGPEEGLCGASWHRNHTHGIGEARARAPPSQHDNHISLLEEASGLANIHGQVHTEVHVLSPGILHWILTHHGEDATVQVGLASRLMIPGHSNDRGPGTVSGHLVSRPRMGQESNHKRPKEVS